MLEKKENNKPDVVLKKYWEKQGTVSDFFNAVLFDGKNGYQTGRIRRLDTDESSILEHKNYAETLKASRDNIAICKKSTRYGINFVMLGIGESGTYSLRNAYENNGL